jgi:hypothetical protein
MAFALVLAPRRGRLRGPAVPWPLKGPAGLFVAGFAVLATVGLSYTSRLQVSGDEPHYLLMAQSLWRDGDLDLRDNLARGEMQEYTPADIQPHWGSPRADGRPFPAHAVGLPALLAPVYAAGGRAACVLLLAALVAWLAVLSRTLAYRLTSDPQASLLAWAAVVGPPAAFYAFHIYTEGPSAFALAGALFLLGGASAGTPAAVTAALLAASLPWLHTKMILAAGALGVLALLRLRGRPLLTFVGVAAIGVAAYLLFFRWIYGSASPLAVYGGTLPADMAGRPSQAAVGLLLDRSFGLLPHAPVFILALAGVVPLLRRPWREVWPLVLVGAAVVLPVLDWRMWWGGQCPPGRFLVPLLPVAGVLIAARAARDGDGAGPRGLLHWRWPLLAWGFALLGLAVAEPGRLLLLNRAGRPTRLWAALSGAGDLGRYLPSLSRPDGAEARVAALWCGALLLLLVLDHLAAHRDRVDRAFRGLGLPLALALALGLGVDLWARTLDGRPPAQNPAEAHGAIGP